MKNVYIISELSYPFNLHKNDILFINENEKEIVTNDVILNSCNTIFSTNKEKFTTFDTRIFTKIIRENSYKNIIDYTDKSLKFDEAFDAIYNGEILEFYGSNNKQPESMGFTYTVKSQKKLCKLFSKINKKFATIEIKILSKYIIDIETNGK